MRAATGSTTDPFGRPVLIIRPGLRGHIIRLSDRDYEDACRLTGRTGALALIDLTVDTPGNRSPFEPLDVADASWEDAEWQ